MHTILVIEDDKDLSVVLSGQLQAQGYKVLTANEGADGIRLARDHRPDLALCDIDMPGVGGYEVLKALRGHHLTADIPLIFLTGKNQPKDIRTGMTLGAEDYLCKPVSPDDAGPRVAIILVFISREHFIISSPPLFSRIKNSGA